MISDIPANAKRPIRSVSFSLLVSYAAPTYNNEAKQRSCTRELGQARLREWPLSSLTWEPDPDNAGVGMCGQDYL